MVNIHIDPSFDDDERRRRLFAGEVIVYTDVPEVAAFAAFTRELVTEVFAPDDPPRSTIAAPRRSWRMSSSTSSPASSTTRAR